MLGIEIFLKSFLHFFGKWFRFPVVKFVSFSWAVLTLIVSPSLNAICTDASELVLIGGICVEIVTLSLLLVLCGAIMILKVAIYIHRLSVVIVQILVDLLLILVSHFQVNCHFQCFSWWQRFLGVLFACRDPTYSVWIFCILVLSLCHLGCVTTSVCSMCLP